MKFINKLVVVAFLMLFTVQCDLIDSDSLVNPNALAPEQVNPDFLLNNIQWELRGIHREAAEVGAELTRMRYLFGGTYGDAYVPTDFTINTLFYTPAYSDVLIDIQNLLEITPEEELHFHTGMAKILQAYTMIMLVDYFGDVPYEQALVGSEIFNPEVDSGESIYNAAIQLLDEAKADLVREGRLSMPTDDLYFPGLSTANKEDRWTRVANTIKLKAYLNTGNVGAINDLIAEDMLITEAAHNFTFEYSTNRTNPDSRHPSFTNNYVDLANDYMSVNYMNMMVNDKFDEIGRDPRMRYYFYRQSTSDADDINDNTCLGASRPGHFQANDPFCLIENGEGYWGRDHLIDDGIPPDRGLRTTFGVYPAGGQYDLSIGVSVEEDMGYEGAGFEPILMSSFTHFMLAEAQEVLGASGDARASLETAVRQSFTAVANFGADQAEGETGEITEEVIDDYVAIVLGRWDDAGYSNLRNIAKEYYFALWPNGYEAYNLMRRTGYPNRTDNLQPARTSSPGNWYNSLFYPANLVDRNSNVSQKDRTERVFWNQGADFNFGF